jgi:pSer/pThr/pTyr-binding forkhead associated (FHA) protein
MPAHFFCQTGEFAGSSFTIADEAMIGRNEDDVRLPAELVSGTHARIYFDAERSSYFLEDLGSRNGTKLDGMPVSDPVKLGRLHVVTFADRIDFIFHEGGGAAATRQAPPQEDTHTRPLEHTQPQAFAPTGAPPVDEDGGTQTIRTDAYSPGALPGGDKAASNQTVRTDAYTPSALPSEEDVSAEVEADGTQTIRTDAYNPGALPTPSADSDSAAQTRIGQAFAPTPNLPGSGASDSNAVGATESIRFSLEVTRGDRGRITFPLSEGENTVGRASNCAVSIDDQSVSREHALVTVRNGRVMLKDLGSRNHTFLDGDRVTSEVEVPLGAVVRFGVESEARLRRA